MPEEIKVVLEADARQLTGEFRKAQDAAAALSSKALPLVGAGLNNAFVQGEKLRKGMKDSARGFGNAGGNMMIFAQAADDAQYGMRGLSNQIPQLAQALGLGAGLAGAIGIASVAATVLIPLLREMYTDTDAPKIKAVADATAKRYAEELAAIRQVTDAKERQAQVEEMVAGLASYAASELRIQDQRLVVLENQRREMELQRQLADQLAAAAGGPSAAASNQVARLQEDLALARKEAQIANAEYDRRAIGAANVKDIADARVAAAEAEVDRLKRNIAGGNANRVGAEKGIELGIHGSKANLARANDQLARDSAALALMETLATATREAAEKAAAQAAGLLGDLSARIDAAERQKRIYAAQLPILRQIAELEQERNRQAAVVAAADGPLNDMESLLGDLSGIKAKAAEEADRRAGIDSARRAFAEEQQVLALRARGQIAQADALQKEIDLRRQALDLSRALGISEDQALGLARDRQRMIDMAENGGIAAAGMPGSKIKKARPERGLRGGGIWRPGGLRPAAEEAAAKRAAPVVDPLATKASLYYDRSLQNEEAILKIFTALGIA